MKPDGAEHAARLSQLHRVRDHDGMLLIFEHNPLNPVTVRVVNQCPFDINARPIGARTLKRRVIETDFVDVSLRFQLFMPEAPSRLRFIERYLRWLLTGIQYDVVARKQGA